MKIKLFGLDEKTSKIILITLFGSFILGSVIGPWLNQKLSKFYDETILGKRPNFEIILSSFALGDSSDNGIFIYKMIKAYEGDSCIALSLVNSSKSYLNTVAPIVIPTGSYKTLLHEIYKNETCKFYIISVQNNGKELATSIKLSINKFNKAGGVQTLNFYRDRLLPTDIYAEEIESCGVPDSISIWSNEQRAFKETIYLDYIVNYCSEIYTVIKNNPN